MTLDFNDERWAIYAEIHNLRTTDPQQACYWTGWEPNWTSKKYGWGTFNGACDPLHIREARTFLGAYASVLKAVWQLKQN